MATNGNQNESNGKISTEEYNERQSSDIDAAWHEAKMMRDQLTGDGSRYHVLMLEKSRCIADFQFFTEGDDGLPYVTHANPIVSQVGEILKEGDLRQQGYRAGRLVSYNVLTDEIRNIILQPRKRKA